MAAHTAKKARMDTAMEIDQEPTAKVHDPTKRRAALQALFSLAQDIKANCGFVNSDVIDLDESNIVSGILSSVFTFYRKRANLVAKGKTAAVEELKLEYRGKEVTVGARVTNVTDLVAALDEPGTERVFDYMVATPLMNMITSFKLSLTEARLGTSKFTKGVDDNGKKVRLDIKNYGLNTTHLPWLTGITYPPERRTGLMKCMGALTLGIGLINNKTYQDKNLAAFNESISHIDANGEIGTFLSKAKRAEISTVLTVLGDVLHLAGERSHRKMAFPLFALIRAYTEDADLFLTGNFSSIGGFRAYDLMKKYNYRILTRTTSPDHIKQVVFHATFGTIFEDLGTLADITNMAQWSQRAELDAAFQRSTDGTNVARKLDFTGLIGFTKYSKLVSSNITPFGAGTLPQNVSRPTFAGFRNRIISKELKTYLETGNQGSVFGATAYEIVTHLAAKKKLLKEMAENKLTMGTVGWAAGYERKADSDSWAWTGVSMDPVAETGVYVYGINSKLAK